MDKRRIIQSVALGVLAEAVSKLVPLVILFIVVRRLGVESFGLAQFGFWVIDVGIVFVVQGFSHQAAVELGAAAGDPRVQGRIVSEVLVCKLVNAFFAFAALALILSGFNIYEPYHTVIYALSFLLFTSALDLSFLHFGTQRMRSWSMILVAVKIMTLLAVILLVRDPEDALTYALLVNGSNGLVSLMMLLINFKKISWYRPRCAELAKRWSRALPYAAYLPLLMAVERLDLFFVEHVAATEGVGLYSGPVRVTMAIIPLLVAISAVFFSEATALQNNEARGRQLRISSLVVYSLLTPIVIGTWFVRRELVDLLLGTNYLPLADTFAVLVSGLLPYAMIFLLGWQVLIPLGEIAKVNGALLLSVIALCVGLFVSGGTFLYVALAVFVAKFVAAGILLYFYQRLVGRFPWSTTITPLYAGLLMILPFTLMVEYSFILRVAVAALIYGASLLWIFRRYFGEVYRALFQRKAVG